MSNYEEKTYDVHVENVEKNDLSRMETGQSEMELSPQEERRLVRKVDFVLLPILCLLYACALLDRVNISAARVDGMGKDLKLLNPKQNFYSIALLVFFPAYLYVMPIHFQALLLTGLVSLKSLPMSSFDELEPGNCCLASALRSVQSPLVPASSTLGRL